MTTNYLKLSLVLLPALLGNGCIAGEAADQEVGSLLEPIVVAVPARVEAESYERFNEITPAVNSGGKCNRNDGVDMETTGDPNGGNCNVGWTTAGEWLEYDISSPTARNFNITSRVASALTGKTFHVELDGANLGSLSAPASGWQVYADRTYSNISVSAGNHRLRIVFDSGDVNLNYIELTAGSATCSDGIKNGSETGVDCGGSCPACPTTGCQSVALSRSSATASSLESATYPASNAKDGNLTTRWASAFSDPQWIYVDLGASRRVNRVLLRWEAAYSTNYDIEVSQNSAGPWTKVFGTTAGNGAIDDITGLNASARYVRMFSRARKTVYGNSLFEFEVYGDNNPNCSSSGPTCSDGVKNGSETDVDCGGSTCAKCANDKTCLAAADCSSNVCTAGRCAPAPSCSDGVKNGMETGVDCGGVCPACVTSCQNQALVRSAALASSLETAALTAQNAIDGSTTTRWSSAFTDPQWLRVDLGATKKILRVRIDWEAASSKDYRIETSNDGTSWTQVTAVTNATSVNHRIDDLGGLNASGRYVRMNGLTRTTAYGHSIWEFEVYGDNNPNCTPPATATDSDGDRLPDSVESNTGQFVSSTNTGTSPSNPDTDGDGLSDGDEVLGTSAGLNLPALGVSPVKKNILLEYDWFEEAVECTQHSHRPSPGAIDLVSTAFANAPVSNPNGTTGITLIHDYGQGGAFTGGNRISDADGVLAGDVFGAEYQNYKAANFASNRSGYFHYVLMPHRYGTSSTSSGFAEIVGDDVIVSLYCAYSVDSNVANTIMHELGHNLGLHHGGFESDNFKPNYNSVMNYEYQFPGVDNNCIQFGDGVLDYSRGQRISIDENALNESVGLCNNINWDFDYRIPFPTNPNGAPPNGIQQTPYALDITQSGALTALHDHNDWANLIYDFTPSGAGFSLQSLQDYAVCDNPAPMP